MVQLCTSRDQGVRKAEELHPEEERKSQRTKFQPTEFVDDLLSNDQFKSRHTVVRAPKTIITEEKVDDKHKVLCQLPAQGWQGLVRGPHLSCG